MDDGGNEEKEDERRVEELRREGQRLRGELNKK